MGEDTDPDEGVCLPNFKSSVLVSVLTFRDNFNFLCYEKNYVEFWSERQEKMESFALKLNSVKMESFAFELNNIFFFMWHQECC